MKEIAEKSLFEIPVNIKIVLWGFILLGISMFCWGLLKQDKESVLRTWQVFFDKYGILVRYCSFWSFFQCYLAAY